MINLGSDSLAKLSPRRHRCKLSTIIQYNVITSYFSADSNSEATVAVGTPGPKQAANDVQPAAHDFATPTTTTTTTSSEMTTLVSTTAGSESVKNSGSQSANKENDDAVPDRTSSKTDDTVTKSIRASSKGADNPSLQKSNSKESVEENEDEMSIGEGNFTVIDSVGDEE